jgi:hypothetical protein
MRRNNIKREKRRATPIVDLLIVGFDQFLKSYNYF